MAASPDAKYRVKVYELSDDGEWSDKGTGHVQFQIVQSVEAAFMFVHSEVDSSLLLETKVIMEDDAYQRQGDTIVSWTEPMSRQDLALSFAEAAGCQDIWEKLCAVRGIDPNMYPTANEEPSPPTQTFNIPQMEAGNLSAVLEYFQELSPFMREGVAATMVQNDYVKQVVAIFAELEASGDTEQLRVLYLIVRSMVMMNESNLLEQLMSDEFYIPIFGVFEYDPDLKQKISHRQFLKNTASFKQVVPFQNPAIVSRIHQNFRVAYLKDVILPRVMDDATFGTLNSVIFFNSIEIVQHLQEDNRFLSEVFLRLKNLPSVEDKAKAQAEQANLISLLQELVQLSKNLQLEARSTFFKMLVTHGILTVFESALTHPSAKTRLATFEILASFVIQDSRGVRVFMLEQEPTYGLFSELVRRILQDADQGLKGHATDILRQLLDPEAIDQSQEKNQFLNIFYERFLEQLIQVFDAPVPMVGANASPEEATKITRARSDLNVSRNHVCELLTFFVLNHGYRIKYFVLRNNIVGKVCDLMKEDERYIALSAVRFLRACVGLKDEFYFRYMIKNNSFAPLVELFKANAAKYNLINSAIIELFEFIRKENIKSLVAYSVQKFGTELCQITYVDTFITLRKQFEQNKESMSAEELARQDDTSEEMFFAGNNDGSTPGGAGADSQVSTLSLSSGSGDPPSPPSFADQAKPSIGSTAGASTAATANPAITETAAATASSESSDAAAAKTTPQA